MYNAFVQLKKIPVLLGLIILSACQPKPEATKPKTELKLHIKTATIETGDITDTITVFGELALRQEAWLSSQFNGRLSNFSLLKGDKVAKGELMGQIVPARREALLQAADSIADELKPLLEQQEKIIPLFCPISGVVLDVLLHTGDVIAAGSHIAHIADLKTLDVQGEIPVQHLETVRKTKRLKVTFTNFEHAPFFLPVEAFTASVSENQSLIVRLKLNNPKLLFRPGMRVKISFPTSVHKNALLVPRQSLVEEEGQYSVFIIEKNIAKKQTVKTGIMHNDFVEIVSGVKENQQVAIEKAYSLKDNLKVIVK
ncbi:MAG: efflux RND transporter periplasmic adaptor subunit [Prolixibacteraceae bacterium]|nr:efflux RND transporter periplasmic adaptor subunit [Prolixibacteraceae bacterium]